MKDRKNDNNQNNDNTQKYLYYLKRTIVMINESNQKKIESQE